jgi:PKD repeat protein
MKVTSRFDRGARAAFAVVALVASLSIVGTGLSSGASSTSADKVPLCTSPGPGEFTGYSTDNCLDRDPGMTTPIATESTLPDGDLGITVTVDPPDPPCLLAGSIVLSNSPYPCSEPGPGGGIRVYIPGATHAYSLAGQNNFTAYGVAGSPFTEIYDMGGTHVTGILPNFPSGSSYIVSVTVKIQDGPPGYAFKYLGAETSAPTNGKSPPTATFTITQSKTDPNTYTFDGSNSMAQTPGASIVGWKWDFNDGAGGSGTIVTHTYKKPGRYNVTLTVTDSKGQTGTYTAEVDVSALEVLLDPGETDGHLFTVEVTVRNVGSSTLHNVAFDSPDGVVEDTSVAVAGTSGSISLFEGPSTPLPTTLETGEAATTEVTFAVDSQGGLDLLSTVSGTDSSGATQEGKGTAILQIGVHTLTPAEQLQFFQGIILSASQQAGQLINAAKERYGELMAWVSAGGKGALPAWLTGPIADGTTPPAGTAAPDVAGWKVSAARAAGLSDDALAWLPDDPTAGLKAYLTMEDHIGTSSVAALKGTAVGVGSALANAAEFYGQLSVGNPAFTAEASRQLNGLVSDFGAAAAPKIAILGAIVATSHDDGLSLQAASSPVLQQFTKDANAAIDSSLSSAETSMVSYAKLAQSDPQAAAAKMGDAYGTTITNMGVAIATSEFGGGAVSKFAGVIEASLPTAETGASIESVVTSGSASGLTGAIEPVGAQVARQTLESLANGTVLTTEQLENLGGFYAQDAPKVQKIIEDIKAKYGVDIEIQVRPGNPASLQYYVDGTGVPKPEWIKAKATEWTDVVLGAPDATLGKATVYQPTLPSASEMASFSPDQQAAIKARYDTQLDLYAKSTDPNGAFQQLLAASKTADGATVDLGFGRTQTGLRYSTEPVPGSPGSFYVMDNTSGTAKYVLSDADYQAVIDAKTGAHISAADGRGQIELDVMNRLASDTVSFGGHGWSHSGFDLAAKYSEPFIKFATGSMSPEEAEAVYTWFLSQPGPLPAWALKLGKAGAAPTVADLVAAFSPGQFVIKFNGATMRVGYAAGLGK